MPRYPKKGTQADKVLQALLSADGRWVSKRKLQIEMFLPQAGRAINDLENRHGWLGKIEHGNPDEFGWMSYRIVQEPATISINLGI